MISFYGNELTIGLVLANWIIMEALGSALFNRISLRSRRPLLIYALLQISIALYLPLAIALIRTAKNILGLIPGESIGLLPIALSSLVIMGPLSIFDGGQFPCGCRILTDVQGKPLKSAGKVYILEAVGFILAGPVLTYILITSFDSLTIAFFLGVLNLFSCILLLKKVHPGKRNLVLASSGLLAVFIISLFGPAKALNKILISKQWKGKQVMDYSNSVYGNITVTKSADQYTFYSDGIPIITTPLPNTEYNENLVHLAMLSCQSPRRILVLNGGAGGIIGEISKYPVQEIAYTELDPLLIKLLKDYPTELTREEFDDSRLNIKYIDGRRYLLETKSTYDVIIMNLPSPYNLQLNRFYTEEFFLRVKKTLSREGVFIFSLPGSLSYMSPELRNINAVILNTLKNVFSAGSRDCPSCAINVIPGDFNLYLASKKPLILDPQYLSRRLAEKGIKTKLLNENYLSQRLSPYQDEWFRISMGDYRSLRENRDLMPLATFYGILYWNKMFSAKLQKMLTMIGSLNINGIIVIILSVAFLSFMLRRLIPEIRKFSASFAISTSGFSGMGLNLILIYAYQSFYGYVFRHIAMLVTAFMAGLTLGGWLATKNIYKIKNGLWELFWAELALGIFSIALSATLSYAGKFNSAGFLGLFLLLSGICGFLVGWEFPIANKIYSPNEGTSAAAKLYALDLAGAWLAALSVSAVFVPVIGAENTCLIILSIKICSCLFISSVRTRRLR